jgi:hypothetical protein
VESLSRERAEQLARDLPMLEVRVDRATAPAGLSVRVDSLALGAAEWGVPRPVDPGRHVVEASAPGEPMFRRELDLVRGARPTVILIPNLRQATAGGEATTAGPGLGAQRVAALVAGGVGLVGIGIGTVFGLRSLSKRSDADEHCSGGSCRDPRGVELRDQARSAGTVSTFGFISGALGLAGGAALWFTAEDRESSAVRASVGPGSLSVSGRF